MLLEFKLPPGSGGMAAGLIYHSINSQIREINRKHHTRIVEHLREGYKYVIHCRDSDYTLLCLTWKTHNQWHQWRVIEAEDLGEAVSMNRVKPGSSPLRP
jgi:hypothetical protein